ncbi:unnamed protein product, partial [Porites lobata]
RVIYPLDEWEILREQIEYEEELGRGAFGVVYKAILRERIGIEVFNTEVSKRTLLSSKKEPKVVAVKVLHDNPSAEQKEEFKFEIEQMKLLGSHPNVVSLVGCCTLQDEKFLVIEYVPFGDLLTWLRSERKRVYIHQASKKIYDNKEDLKDEGDAKHQVVRLSKSTLSPDELTCSVRLKRRDQNQSDNRDIHDKLNPLRTLFTMINICHDIFLSIYGKKRYFNSAFSHNNDNNNRHNLKIMTIIVTGKEDKKQISLEFISIIQDDDEDKMVCENVKKEQVQANMEMIPLLQDNNEVVKEGGFQKLLICILAKLTTRKKPQALKTCLSSETAEFFSMLVDIVTNNTQYTTKCTNLHPTPTSGDPLAKVNILLYIALNFILSVSCKGLKESRREPIDMSNIPPVDSQHAAATPLLLDEDPDDEEESFSTQQLFKFAWQIAKGMNHLAEKSLVHRDLAARNILVGYDNRVKVSDFGLMRQIYQDVNNSEKSKKLPVKWMAPESLYNGTFTIKSDVWSYGVLLWEMATLGGVPYPTLTNTELYRLLTSGYRMEKPDMCSDEV